MRVMGFVKAIKYPKKALVPSMPGEWADARRGPVCHQTLASVPPALPPASTAVAAAGPAAPHPGMAPIGAYLMDRTQKSPGQKCRAQLHFQGRHYPGADPHRIRNRNQRHQRVRLLGRPRLRRRLRCAGALEPENPRGRLREPASRPHRAALRKLITAMVLAGHTDAETIDRIKNRRTHQGNPATGIGALSYMMSKSSYLTDQGDPRHAACHVLRCGEQPADWGANAPDTPFIGGNYWCFTPGHEAERAALPPLSVFLTGVATWSDGTPATMHRM